MTGVPGPVVDDTVPSLHLWLAEQHVAVLEFDGYGGAWLTYTSRAIDRHGSGAAPLSASLPIRSQPYDPSSAAPFLSRLLPEADAREAVARRFGIPARDIFHLLAAIGRDCAGAVSVVWEDDPPPTDSDGTVEPLTDAQLAELVESLPYRPLGAGPDAPLSLAGLRDKLLLAELPDGKLGRPLHGAPSTHILKPEPEARRMVGLVMNEAWCLRVATLAGLPAAVAQPVQVLDRPALLVRRFDRERRDGGWRRLHQEDCCQALGCPADPDAKYESDAGGPTLRRIAAVLLRHSSRPRDDLVALLDRLVVAVAVHDTDMHGRNLALLHRPGVGIRLAPAYDVACTSPHTGWSEMAMSVNGTTAMDGVTRDDLVQEARAWGIPAGRAGLAIADVLQRLSKAIKTAARELPEGADLVGTLVSSRVRRMAQGDTPA